MKRKEIRSLDLKTIIECDQQKIVDDGWLTLYGWNVGEEYVAVLHEFESELEADKRRVDWLEMQMERGSQRLILSVNGHSFRQTADFYREAYEPTLEVVASPINYTIPRLEGYNVIDARKRNEEKASINHEIYSFAVGNGGKHITWRESYEMEHRRFLEYYKAAMAANKGASRLKRKNDILKARNKQLELELRSLKA